MRLRGDEVQDLRDGLLVGVISEHHALQPVLRHQVADALDDALGVRLVHGEHLHVGCQWHVAKVVFVTHAGERHLTGVSHQHHRDAQALHQLGDGRIMRH